MGWSGSRRKHGSYCPVPKDDLVGDESGDRLCVLPTDVLLDSCPAAHENCAESTPPGLQGCRVHPCVEYSSGHTELP